MWANGTMILEKGDAYKTKETFYLDGNGFLHLEVKRKVILL